MHNNLPKTEKVTIRARYYSFMFPSKNVNGYSNRNDHPRSENFLGVFDRQFKCVFVRRRIVVNAHLPFFVRLSKLTGGLTDKLCGPVTVLKGSCMLKMLTRDVGTVNNTKPSELLNYPSHF